MIDTHCHILNHLDDGSQSTEQTLAMLQTAHEYGIKKIIATPHCWPGIKYPNDRLSVQPAYEEALALIALHQLDIKLYYGCELFATADTMAWVNSQRALTLNQTSVYLLELPWSIHQDKSIHETTFISEMLALGHKVVIAHPERYTIVREQLDILQTWRRLGCSFQVNRTSLLNPESWEYETAWKIMEQGYADIIATDAHHDTGKRIMRLDDIYDLIGKRYNADVAQLLMVDNPQRLIDGQELVHLK
ncbi:MAG: CpsB/CapC family capsule biosynthesis tyrosine phosphatase [Erysipelotrichaceae bacterium]|nr:CpsB/CapC family capsule biosynthesis tyrosine phosphatase [Erysipelotrichaceae bacterium]